MIALEIQDYNKECAKEYFGAAFDYSEWLFDMIFDMAGSYVYESSPYSEPYIASIANKIYYAITDYVRYNGALTEDTSLCQICASRIYKNRNALGSHLVRIHKIQFKDLSHGKESEYQKVTRRIFERVKVEVA